MQRLTGQSYKTLYKPNTNYIFIASIYKSLHALDSELIIKTYRKLKKEKAVFTNQNRCSY